jgi:Fe-S-cluster containining protein
MFEKQAPFIKCKKGCTYCCKEGEYPLSELEYVNLMLYYNKLPNDIKGKINQNIETLMEQKREKFYECPFLINEECSVYPTRPIICRTFGLISYRNDGRPKMPFCIELGLNYANVYDEDKQLLVKCADDGTEPVAYNIDRRTLRNKEMQDLFDIYFGEDKSLISWLQEDNEFTK